MSNEGSSRTDLGKEPKPEPGEGKDSNQGLVCATCGHMNRPGDLACSNCGTLLQVGSSTQRLTGLEESLQRNPWPTGDVIITDQQPILLEIEGRELSIPLSDVVTIGRGSPNAAESQPDVDLTPYGAAEKGISRKHMKIKRKNILIYVADLGSTNGTLLNGRRLIPHAERLLRNGDELQLGSLKMHVRF